jgi:hypothetical protein
MLRRLAGAEPFPVSSSQLLLVSSFQFPVSTVEPSRGSQILQHLTPAMPEPLGVVAG